MAKATKAEETERVVEVMTTLFQIREDSTEGVIKFSPAKELKDKKGNKKMARIANVHIGDELFTIFFNDDNYKSFHDDMKNAKGDDDARDEIMKDVKCWVSSTKDFPGKTVSCYYEAIDEDDCF